MISFSVRDISHKYNRSKELGLIELNDKQTKRVQEITLSIYRDIMTVCSKHNLNISLSGGSALGAVRHHGFIPWDDDIDVMMPRSDYNRFLQLFKEELGDKYDMACPYAKYSNQFFYITKIIDRHSKWGDYFNNSVIFSEGLCVDVLPIDYVPNNFLLYYVKGFISIILLFIVNSRMMWICRTNISDRLFSQTTFSSFYYYFRLMCGFITGVLPYRKWCSLFDSWVSQKKESKRVSIPSGRNHYFKETHSVGIFFPFKKAKFEDVTSFIPNIENAYLSKLYGNNYMAIPPVNKRERHLCTYLDLPCES